MAETGPVRMSASVLSPRGERRKSGCTCMERVVCYTDRVQHGDCCWLGRKKHDQLSHGMCLKQSAMHGEAVVKLNWLSGNGLTTMNTGSNASADTRSANASTPLSPPRTRKHTLNTSLFISMINAVLPRTLRSLIASQNPVAKPTVHRRRCAGSPSLCPYIMLLNCDLCDL